MENQNTQELVAEFERTAASVAGIPATAVWIESDGFAKGTYAVKELVYAYAMWISAAFHLHVIRAYDALVQQQAAPPAPPLADQPQHRADQLVSAGRIFAAAGRAARRSLPRNGQAPYDRYTRARTRGSLPGVDRLP